MSRLPLVRLPSFASIYPLGAPTSISATSALLRFGEVGWTVNQGRSGGQHEGWAIVGDGEGRRATVEVSQSSFFTPSPLMRV